MQCYITLLVLLNIVSIHCIIHFLLYVLHSRSAVSLLPLWSSATYLQLLAFEHSNMTQCEIPLPNRILAQPNSPLEEFLAQRQREQRVGLLNCHGRTPQFFIKHVPPFFVPKARIIVIEGPCDIFNLPFPLGGGLPNQRRIVWDPPQAVSNAVRSLLQDVVENEGLRSTYNPRYSISELVLHQV